MTYPVLITPAAEDNLREAYTFALLASNEKTAQEKMEAIFEKIISLGGLSLSRLPLPPGFRPRRKRATFGGVLLFDFLFFRRKTNFHPCRHASTRVAKSSIPPIQNFWGKRAVDSFILLPCAI
jgi:hypothetical protein